MKRIIDTKRESNHLKREIEIGERGEERGDSNNERRRAKDRERDGNLIKLCMHCE